MGGRAGVELRNVALSDVDGEIRMWVDEHAAAQMSSATGAPHEGATQQVVPRRSGDALLAEEGIAHVDLLKIDTEGHEMEVLAGFGEALASRRIEVVQFEYTRWAVVARRFLGDFYRLFDDYGYSTGRLMQSSIDWTPYSIDLEGFLRSNYVAVRRGSSAAELLGAPT